ncbi:hypothetical protein DIPPA_17121 [Diplonema papillatum]|nr:hypothetical protein DIPPA_17121 [Diplonema papillatum]
MGCCNQKELALARAAKRPEKGARAGDSDSQASDESDSTVFGARSKFEGKRIAQFEKLVPEFSADYQLGRVLGQGKFGVVVLCRKREDRKLVVDNACNPAASEISFDESSANSELNSTNHHATGHNLPVGLTHAQPNDAQNGKASNSSHTHNNNRKTDHVPSSSVFAAKILVKNTPITMRQIENELMGASVLRSFAHVNLTKLITHYENDNAAALVYERNGGGQLYLNRLRNAQHPSKKAVLTHYSETAIINIVTGILRGVEHLHSKGLAHLDLKMENVLLKTKKNPAKVRPDDIAIIDFGSLTSFTPGQADIREIAGTPEFAAPEVLQVYSKMLSMQHGNIANDSFEVESFDERCDVWSVGVITYLLLCGHFPFFTRTPPTMESLCQVVLDARLVFPTHLSPDMRSFLSLCLAKDFRDRSRTWELLSHPWLTERRVAKIGGDLEQFGSKDAVNSIVSACLSKHESQVNLLVSLQSKLIARSERRKAVPADATKILLQDPQELPVEQQEKFHERKAEIVAQMPEVSNVPHVESEVCSDDDNRSVPSISPSDSPTAPSPALGPQEPKALGEQEATSTPSQHATPN